MTQPQPWHEPPLAFSEFNPAVSSTLAKRHWNNSLRSLFTLFILNSILLLYSPSTTTHAATFEVSVTKPSPRFDHLTTGHTSGTESVLLKPFSSKYLGNSVVTNARNLGYSGTIVLGNNPPQSFKVVFDTGSDMIVITSDQCMGVHCEDMTHYSCASCTKTPYSYNISYGDGTWGSGPIVEDTASIGGLVVHNQQILDITQSALDLSSYGPGISGLVGLMPGSPIKNVNPLLATIFKEKLLDMNVFSVYLAPTLKMNQGGSFLFGGIDSTKFDGELNQVPISKAATVRKGMWYIDAEHALVGGVPVNGYVKSPWLFDTGTSFIAVPMAFARAFHDMIPGSEYSDVDEFYTVPCEGNQSFAVEFNGITYEVPYLDYVAAPMDESTSCVSLVMPLGKFEMYILGDPFLRQVYTVYDFTPGKSRIGLAKVNVKNASLGNEGLSGESGPGGRFISRYPSSLALSRFGGQSALQTICMAIIMAVVAMLT
ncbi:Vacuolar protease A [Haplosporangium sp. Z 11]|nr:Vacuolar protease A [Haplosporangium sp. Z 11]